MPRRFGFAALALLAAALLAGLGVWQIERRAWKLDLIAKVEARLAAPPVALPPPSSWPDLARNGAYLRVRLSGAWRPSPPVFVKAVTDLGGGWWVLSPLASAHGTVLVNRGFVPDDQRRTIRPAQGKATVSGLLRLSEPGGAFLRTNDPAHDRWYSRDVAAIARARALGAVAPFFIDADAASSTGWPRGGMTVVRFPNNHLLYAVTWFGLAAMALWLVWLILRGEAD